MPSSVTNPLGSYLPRVLERARLVRAVRGDGLARRGRLDAPPLAAESAGVVSAPGEAPLSASFAARARCRSSFLWRISTIEGHWSLRQSFQGRPRKPFTVNRGISPQMEQRSSRRQSSYPRPGRGPETWQEFGESG